MAQLLSNLPIGARIKFGKYSVNGEVAQPIVWLIVDKNHGGTPAYPSNSVTLLAEKIVDMRCYDAKESYGEGGVEDHVTQGNERYSVSNIDQWLNKDSEAGQWYVAAHPRDLPPDSVNTGGSLAHYVGRPGFLNAFSNDEKGSILDTPIRAYKNAVSGGTLEEFTRKVFLPAVVELDETTNNPNMGTVWAYFKNNPNWACGLSEQAFQYSPLQGKNPSISANYSWWTRTAAYIGTLGLVWSIDAQGRKSDKMGAYSSIVGVRPALNLASATPISETIDTDGCYVTAFNTAPLAPSLISLPSAIYGGKSNAISWSKAVDVDGDTLSYRLECSMDSGEYNVIYEGGAIAYTHLVPFGVSTVSYRVKATDPDGESSDYTYSNTVNVINNNAPVISGADGNLGVKTDDFTGTYTITDANSDVVTVTEAIDGVRIRSLVVPLGEEITYGVTESTWLALPNGSHTLTISATDGIDTTIRTFVFTKLVDKFSIQNSTPWQSSTMPTRIMLVVTRNLPSTSTFKVEVCNNGFDASPTWEDATDAVKSGLVHVMTNTHKTAENWGVLVKVTVERNGATGACYVSAIGGNFE